jgi:hypothetical protein
MAKKKVFVSFDFDRDQKLRDFIIGQAKNPDSPFEVSDYSLKEAKPEAQWEAKARAAIARSDVFIVMLGSQTRWASGVLKEVAIANQLFAAGRIENRLQIIGYKDGSSDWRLPGAGPVYRWNWENLKKLLA